MKTALRRILDVYKRQIQYCGFRGSYGARHLRDQYSGVFYGFCGTDGIRPYFGGNAARRQSRQGSEGAVSYTHLKALRWRKLGMLQAISAPLL